MKLESQVVSLELAQKLKELGVKQESLFYWREYWLHPIVDDKKWELADVIDTHALQNVSAFTVAELGEMLPEGSYSVRDDGKKAGTPPLHACWYQKHMELGTTEADARGKMLVYLLENKLITI